MTATNYEAILAENKRRYGTDIGRIGPMLLADRYADRTHFIYELLQNAEDALARREDWDGHRAVKFHLTKTSLQVSHYGIPFTNEDVQGICGIAESTKGLTSIGRFGIGFKSVYAFTDCPQIHSGAEHFAVDCFVWPREIPPVQGELGETIFILPLRPTDATAHSEIASGLQKLGARTLLFLKEIEEISWYVEGGPSGLYLRDKPSPFGDIGRKIVVIGQLHGAEDVTEETWVVFSREVRTSEEIVVGHIEVAFALAKSSENGVLSVVPVNDSNLVVFFPTIVQTNLGLLVQGPYRTTPSRDNIPRNDPWNKHLVQETSTLLVEALRSLRDNGLLNANALTTLPLDRSKFPEGSMFAPLYGAIRDALSSEPLLPCYGGGHAHAKMTRLGRTQEIRELISSSQLAKILEKPDEISWLSDDITLNRMPELRRYLMQDLEIIEITPEMLIPRFNRSFLEDQTDEWVAKLYEFLNGQPARQRRLDDIPLIRLEDGSHVPVKVNGQLQAFLPGSIITEFPTVRRSVCTSAEALEFLKSLGLSEPDPVDDVIRNVLPKYDADEVDISDADYAADINRILKAFSTDSKVQREKLIEALRGSAFVMAVDLGDASKWISKPANVYLATQRLKDLFEGVKEVLLVDDSYACLKGEDVRELLEACGATRYLQPIPFDPQFTWEEKKEMRRKGGCEDCTYDRGIEDFTLRGLEELLAVLPSLDDTEAGKKAGLVWEALRDVEDRRGAAVFTATYRWKYHYNRSYEFDAAFVRILNDTAWIPRDNASLEQPCFAFFEETGWKPYAFLLSKIRFKPPIIAALAREAGIEPGMLDLLKKLGVTSEAELKARLGIKDEEIKRPSEQPPEGLTPEDAIKRLGLPPMGQPSTDVKPEAASGDAADKEGSRAGTGAKGAVGANVEGNAAGGPHSGRTSEGGTKNGAQTGTTHRPFISYVAVHRDEDGADPDGLSREERLALEELATTLIIEHDPQLLRMPENNPGFDLIEPDSAGSPIRWIEVKAMRGDMTTRPVGLSHTQFECAREHGPSYWLYIVEHAGIEDRARIVRIQDPAGKARTFTFDRGWLTVAEIDT